MTPHCNILVAWPYLTQSIINYVRSENDPRLRFLVDSGAFTAWKQGQVLDVDDYCRLLEDIHDVTWRYFTLDVIGDPAGTQKNLDKMIDRGFKPIPVFTRGENPSVIDDYYKLSDVVAIGGLVGTKGNRGFVKGIMEVVGDRKVHWLGFGPADFLSHYKPYSFDSSSQSAAIRYGQIRLYKGRGVWEATNKDTYQNRPSVALQNLFDTYGVDIRRMQKVENWTGIRKAVTAELSFKSWARYQRDVEIHYGTKLFIACAVDTIVWLAHLAFNYWEYSDEKTRSTFWRDGLSRLPRADGKWNRPVEC